MDKSNVIIYTDGSCLDNPGPGGWSFIIEHPASNSKIEGSGGQPDSTNNQMELMGLIKALESLKLSCNVTVCSDSQYLLKGISEWLPGWVKNNWKRGKKKDQPVKNIDLWKQLHEFTKKHTIKVHWVKGHNGHKYNEICDKMAQTAARQIQKGV